jgi:hypothetical protein
MTQMCQNELEKLNQMISLEFLLLIYQIN